MGFPKKTWGSFITKPAFEIIPGDDSSFDNPYMIGEGFLFKTFSLSVDTKIPIDNLGVTFDFKKNNKFYIEIDVDSNLQPYYATIKCEEVNTDESWKYYPFNSLIEPEFTDTDREKFSEFPWDSGRILKLLPDRRQTKLYILIGYREDDENKNGNQSNSFEENATPVQILKENIILLGGIVDYAPGLIPVPYFYGGFSHIEALIQDKEKE